MFKNVYEIKKDYNLNDLEYNTLVNQGYITEEVIVDQEGFIHICVNDMLLESLKKRETAR